MCVAIWEVVRNCGTESGLITLGEASMSAPATRLTALLSQSASQVPALRNTCEECTPDSDVVRPDKPKPVYSQSEIHAFHH